MGGDVAAQADEFEDVIAHAAQHVFGLEKASAGEAGADMQGIKPRHADQGMSFGRRRRARRVRVAEDELEVRTNGAEIGGAPEGEVDLQRVFEEEDAEERGPAHDVDVRDGVVALVEARSPFGHDVLVRGVRFHTKGEVDIGPAIETGRSGRAGVSGAAEAGVMLGGGDKFMAQLFSFFGSEYGHAGMVIEEWCLMAKSVS